VGAGPRWRSQGGPLRLRTSPETASQYFVSGSSAAEISSIALQTVTAHARHGLLTADAFQPPRSRPVTFSAPSCPSQLPIPL
jgi:hypothetical protein